MASKKADQLDALNATIAQRRKDPQRLVSASSTIRGHARLMLLTAVVVVATLVASSPSIGSASGLASARQQAATSLAQSTARASQQTATAPAQSTGLSQPMPVDPQITIGKFSNGLRYYIRANKKPEKRAELRLVVKAGSILEDDDQQGLAHFVEHMAFNGTKNFPKQDLVQFIESLGMRFGADLNAYTSFDETVYMLQVPTDKPETMDKALLILEDWAHNVTFDPAEIEKERGVVMEEWRARRGAGARMQSTRSFRSCSRARATPTGCQSANRRSSRAARPSG